ncbi:MAG: hypothetical protein M3164_03755 [Actinomycetota bacterium]|nr:hypothetical protein [Actinomycetota bacterium]
MTRRVNLPGADELFRRTMDPKPIAVERETEGLPAAKPGGDGRAPRETESPASRPKHEAKVTFYCTDEELTRLERARLVLRAEHRIAADRGKLVRAALTEVLDDFEARGPNSRLLRRLKSTNG